ncbi:uncharacterized protein N7469_009315 [Penicillium citrinum]|uniref:Amino acid transporter n=1 Tax=Penicillium citrinum TaxID=5077 RepID=A0A9W9NN67_PENCI|nr:uncharacterized protein N7469_009315 [Penicillium citrinum]KAJ5223075.1 hypothetical protein N7469_009315 [Penicillium citrinum]
MHQFEDDRELEARGYRREMPRQFSVFSLVALSFSLTCTWSGTGSSMGISITEASAAGTLWSIPVAALMTTILSAGVAELASAYPVAGAQYYWAFFLSSDKYRAFASYIRRNHATVEWIFADTTNGTGWPSNGFAFILAISNAVYAFLGTDCGAHLCEEIRDPAKNAPKIILYPILIGLVTAWPFACACMYAITDVEAVLNTPSGLPLIEIYYQSTQSKSAASILLALFAFCFFGCSVANDPTFQIPLNALCLSGTVISLYGLIFLGSSTAFSAMVGAAVIFLQTSCALPQAILLFRGRDHVLPERPFTLGRLGPIINFLAVAWVVFLDILCCIPTEMPVTKENMNYISVVTFGLTSIVLLMYVFCKKGKYLGPRMPSGGLHLDGQEVSFKEGKHVNLHESKDD